MNPPLKSLPPLRDRLSKGGYVKFFEKRKTKNDQRFAVLTFEF